MAAEYTSGCQVESFEGSVFAEGFQGILRTGGSKSAARGFEGGDAYLVESYQENERRYRDLLDDTFEFAGVICHNFRYEYSGSNPE